jgi:hypothetical protein
MRSPTVISTICAPCPPDALHPGLFAPGLGRVVVAWAALTLASFTGPCRPLSPSPAFAAEASQ